ncbi:MAG: hypothetical protein A4E73_02602 [Syntrophaceae bacterium PtaU1.Bin231]|nr:MAG: hypothetical protein A4E73_02602 [Syntrophaceae bacterium PtaU1.Bin231]
MGDRSMFALPLRTASARFLLLGCAVVLTAVVLMQGPALAAKDKQKAFESPEAAVEALLQALRGDDEKALLSIFGTGGKSLISSGDAVDDRDRRGRFVRLYEERHRLEEAADGKLVLHVGNTDWPFPIPIVKTGEMWRFDTKQGREEILNRRIGENEHEAIKTCLAIVDAQREYAAADRDGDGLLEYARKFRSTPGKMDGLYWDVRPGEQPSPLGPLIAKARGEGYARGEKPAPYNGYFFRILTAQGKNARGGAYSYLVKGKMVGGFAVVAYPATYGVSGVKTFIVNHEGVVYEKDLGPGTARMAKAMKLYNPDETWEKAQ